LKKILILFCLLILNIKSEEKISYKIKLYAISSESHEELKNKYFLPSIKDDYKIILVSDKQICRTAKYREPGWNEFMIKKVDLILRAIKENWNKIFIYSDVDIQFFKTFKELIPKLMENKDINIQKNTLYGDLCAGFFICRANERTLKLWKEIKNLMHKNNKLDDQVPLNNLLVKSNPFNVKYSSLPNEFFQPGLYKKQLWNPGNNLEIPKNIILHHACYTIGIQNKIAQLEYVKKLVK